VRLVLLGDPVEHSRSPAIHTAALAAVGIPGSYTARRVDAAGVRRACDEMRRGELDGANVTMPHKRVAAAAADRLSPEASRAGSVNTLVPDDGRVIGHTTDVDGVRIAWGWAGLPEDSPVLVLGAGGAAAAAMVALEGHEVLVSGRRPGAGPAVAAALGVACREVPWGEVVDGAVVVNATPLGMAGESLPAGLVAAAAGVFDMAYGPAATPAVVEGRRLGLPVADGASMLVAQAARSFELWTGVRAPLPVMLDAVR